MPGPALAYNISEYSPAEAELYVSLTVTQNYVFYAVSALLVYELVVTFDEEVERVWSLKWRLPKLLFMFNRYITRGLLILQFIAGGYPGTTAGFCQVYGYWQVFPARLAILGAQAIMVIRLWAIYNNARNMLSFLAALYTLEVAAVVTCSAMAVETTQGASQPAPLSCGLEPLSPMLRQYASGTWIAPVCFELIIVVLTVAKLLPPLPPQYRILEMMDGNFLKGLSSHPSVRNPTLDILARDSLIYFAFAFSEFLLASPLNQTNEGYVAFTLANAVLYETSFAAYYRSILLGPTAAISCIAVSRMIINIRSLPAPNFAAEGAAGSFNFVSSDVVFAENSAYVYDSEPELNGVSEVQRLGLVVGQNQPFRARVSGKEQDSEIGEFEIIHTPRRGLIP
ncbi:hypothetical protein MSAN_01490400 [Mycena sanguinolenta]|uniref:DUF6533 domain-containing protein n=1 Tax=Mycena sanguinolenta TaxID=230812 RepID=A0A8H6Y7I5_9AGAR|nr:hypothetical protein MSAN_01490400 [Mycena sanguinolenta]